MVIRLSAMGDVAMTVPVLRQVLDTYPNLHIDLLTRSSFRPLFPNHPRLQFIFPALQTTHKGFPGLIRLFGELRKNNYNAVADLHDVLRSQIIRTLFYLSGTRIYNINKGRKEKKALTRKNNKIKTQLKSTHQRYADVFDKLGYSIKLKNEIINLKSPHAHPSIGIAPFAAHREKMWPMEKTEKLIDRLLSTFNGTIYLFGGGENERNILDEMSSKSHRIISTANESLEAQIETMASMEVLLSMDSANMHIASNLGISVVSIWGATHPFAGFLGYGQSQSDCIQQEDLDCRPCSVFGNKTCWRGDWACMDIEVEQVFANLERYLV